MSAEETVRMWKAVESNDNPAGPMEVTDEELQEVHGGSRCGSFYLSGKPCHCI
jgi:hypothetical protein